jgi:lipopolysaccharide/colanic/teichoic acid biosynthesis glycosyltransferase
MPGLIHSPILTVPAPRQIKVRLRRAVRASVSATVRPLVLNESLFRDALGRERRRADRFEESFALVLITLAQPAQAKQRDNEIIDTLAASRRDGDIIGWYEQGTVLGLIRSRSGHDVHETAAHLASIVHQELACSLAGDALSGCSIRLDVYSPHAKSAPVFLGEQVKRQSSPLTWLFRKLVKRAIDIAGSAALLTMLSPIFLVLAALVKLTSRGPVFYRQERVGQGAETFTMLKFRTMRVDASHELHQEYVSAFIQAQAQQTTTATAPVFKIVNDPRITPIGHFLRRSSLDELPQFWNVLKGQMSLVGPRPPLPYEVRVYRPWHRRRLLEAKPGITGLWQVTGRSRTTFDEMVRLDLRYARNHSVWADVKILLATPRAVISGNGAH